MRTSCGAGRLRVNQLLFQQKGGTSADVDQAKSRCAIAGAGLLDAEENLRQKKRTLGELLNVLPDQAEQIELRGTIGDLAPPAEPGRAAPDRLQLAARHRRVSAGHRRRRSQRQLQLANRLPTRTYWCSRTHIRTTHPMVGRVGLRTPWE